MSVFDEIDNAVAGEGRVLTSSEISELLPEGYISLEECLIRFGIAKSTFTYHRKQGTISPDVTEMITEPVEGGGMSFPKGLYVDWKRVGMSLLPKLKVDKRLKIHHNLKTFGFGSDLEPLVAGQGVVRMTNYDCKAYRSAGGVSEGSGITPFSIGIGYICPEHSGVPTTSRKIIRGESNPYLPLSAPKREIVESSPRPNPEEEPQAPTEENREAPSSTLSNLESLTVDQVNEQFDTLLADIDYSNPDEVQKAANMIELQDKYNKALIQKLKAAKLSNSSIEMDEISKLLEGAMVAIRTTMMQAVPKLTEEIIGAVITQITMKDPSLQKVLVNGVDKIQTQELLRDALGRSLHEMADILKAFSQSGDEDESED